MTLRVEVRQDCRIEIMRPRGNRSQFLHFPSLDSAMRVIRFFIKRDLERAEKERFVPQLHKEAKKAFKQLQERSPSV
ncbi:MAG: hypothetical protein JW793_14270 [Acidobacteria bacterium]|nr:hypothetical protein [Acidobacteriota bacterium]